MFIALALLAGALVIICISINGRLARQVGLIQAGMTNFLVGLLSSIIYVYLINGFSWNSIQTPISNVPIYYFLGGAIGSLIMLLNSLIINRLSAVYVTILVFIGQMATGIIIDYFRWEVISKGKIIGGILLFTGLIYYMKGDKNTRSKKKSQCQLNTNV